MTEAKKKDGRSKNGGARKGAGRPRTLPYGGTAVWLPSEVAYRAKNEYYEALDALIDDWLYQEEDENIRKSPRWQRAKELLEQARALRDEGYKFPES